MYHAFRIVCLFCFLHLAGIRCAAQHLYPLNYFRSPLDTVLLLSAPFGQLRDNHFHSGLDIRTFEKEGLPVYAVADGWVSRIKVSPWGYGNALYIDHPNGYTSVYGHLKNYNDTITACIRAIQYSKESFEAETFPRKNHIPVKKGDLIAWTGNTGGSTGPHLHFELRNTQTEFIINPLLFQLPVTDTLPPFFKSFSVYNLMCNRPLLVLQQPLNRNNQLRDTSGIIWYTDTLEVPSGTIGFGTEVYDYITDPDREQNVYLLRLVADSTQLFEMNMRSFSFGETRCVNTHIDYQKYWDDRIRIQKCFLDDGNRAEIYRPNTTRGRFQLADTLLHQLRFTALDAMGNQSVLVVHLRAKPGMSLSAKSGSSCTYEICYPGTTNHIHLKDVRVEIPQHSLYDTLDFCLEHFPVSKRTRSRIFRIGTATVPMRSGCTISIRPNAHDSLLFDKMLVVRVNDKGYTSAAGGHYRNGWVTTSGRSFGDYAIGIDSTPPKARFLNITRDSINTDSTALSIEITDNLSGIDDYRLLLNGKWVLAEYDAKNDQLIYRYDAHAVCGSKQSFELMVTDKKRNKTVSQKQIYIPCKN